jgi:hypothetical protein
LGAYNEINLTKWFFQYNWQIVGKRLQYRDFQTEMFPAEGPLQARKPENHCRKQFYKKGGRL